MADVQVTAASFEDGVLTVSGAGFTRTTTQLFVDGRQVTFDVTDDTRITASDIAAGASQVWAVKGEIESEHIWIYPAKTAEANTTPGDVSDDKTTSDVSEEDLAGAANAGASAKQPDPIEPNREPYEDTEHLDHDFRTRVENTAVVTMEKLGIGAKDPYPEGDPPDPEEVFQELHGYPRPPADDGQAPQPEA